MPKRVNGFQYALGQIGSGSARSKSVAMLLDEHDLPTGEWLVLDELSWRAGTIAWFSAECGALDVPEVSLRSAPFKTSRLLNGSMCLWHRPHRPPTLCPWCRGCRNVVYEIAGRSRRLLRSDGLKTC